MDPTPPSSIVRAEPMRADGLGCGQLLLPRGPGVGGEPFLPAIAGRGIYTTPVLRRAQNDDVAAFAALRGGSQTGAPVAAEHGSDGGLSQAALESQSIGAQAFPLFAQRVWPSSGPIRSGASTSRIFGCRAGLFTWRR
jgi:hypothetical protein